MTTPAQRRSHPRSRFHCFAHYRMMDANPNDFGLLCITKDFSHDGLYFLALNDLIRLRMQLLLKFPCVTEAGKIDRECLVEVVRTQAIFPGRSGIGVKLIGYRDRQKLRDNLELPDISPSQVTYSCPIDVYA